ncbi:hypothetical protein SNE35_16935 [Paucibacter sp. R3-3]|uniref:Uncharacterized protein n=1 Tax=Roseateles agri TaxID=3098619 RepID=A0ABU5DKC0_9BURK|nr:hypothetical protein [Paucibacter sp. R3-3]MDY0746206.1 hypothetical protein [Paucibacter sp. R3-3]
MAEKLSKEVWVTFTKKNKLSLDDGALLKALEKFDKCDEKQHEARSAALEGIVDQVKKQVALLVKAKKGLGDKLFGQAKDKLYELLDEAEKLQKSEAHAGNAEDEEADSPTLLTSAMIPLVRTLQKGETTMPALIAVTSKKTAVLISRRAISPARRKLLAEYLQETSGIKYLMAQCTGASGQLEFQLDSSPGGLSKRLKQAVFDQTGLRTRITLRFGEESESDGEEEESGGGAEADDPLLATYMARFEALDEPYRQALRRNPEMEAKLLALHGFAIDKAEVHQFQAALQALDRLEKLINETPAATAAGGAKPASFVAFTQTRLAWDQTRKAVQADLRKLEAEILARCKDESDFADIEVGAKTLYEMLDVLDERLIDKLDEALNAATPQARQQLHLQAREIVDEYLEFVETDELVADIDANGFVDTAVRSTLTARLHDMAGRLASSYAA